MPIHPIDDDEYTTGRRTLLKAIVAGGGAIASRVLLPALWSTPIISAMELPAHASTSSSTSLPTTPSSDSQEVAGSGPGSVAIAATVAAGVVTLTITPPSQFLANAVTQYQVYEQLADSSGATFVRVVGLMAPSQNSALSATTTLQLTRTSGTYSYQLRATALSAGQVVNYNTAWVSVVVS